MSSGEFTSPEDILESLGPAPEASVLSMDYYRQKALEFQAVLNAIDQTDQQLVGLIRTLPPGLLVDELIASQSELLDKKGQLKIVAEAINFVANGLNVAGVNFPKLQIPQTLGAVPLALGAAAAAAIAAAAALIIWGRDWIAGVNQRLRDENLIQSVPEGQRAEVAQAIVKTDAARIAAESSPLAAVAGIVRWVALGAIAFFAYQAWTRYAPRGGAED